MGVWSLVSNPLHDIFTWSLIWAMSPPPSPLMLPLEPLMTPVSPTFYDDHWSPLLSPLTHFKGGLTHLNFISLDNFLQERASQDALCCHSSNPGPPCPHCHGSTWLPGCALCQRLQRRPEAGPRPLLLSCRPSQCRSCTIYMTAELCAVPEAAAKARGRPPAAAAVLPAVAVSELHKLTRTADTKGALSAASPEGGPPLVSDAAQEMTWTFLINSAQIHVGWIILVFIAWLTFSFCRFSLLEFFFVIKQPISTEIQNSLNPNRPLCCDELFVKKITGRGSSGDTYVYL